MAFVGKPAKSSELRAFKSKAHQVFQIQNLTFQSKASHLGCGNQRLYDAFDKRMKVVNVQDIQILNNKTEITFITSNQII